MTKFCLPIRVVCARTEKGDTLNRNMLESELVATSIFCLSISMLCLRVAFAVTEFVAVRWVLRHPTYWQLLYKHGNNKHAEILITIFWHYQDFAVFGCNGAESVAK